MSLLPVGIGNAGGEYTLDNSLRFRGSATAYLNKTFTTPTNQNIWSFSAWLKRGTIADQQFLFWAGTSATNDCALYFSSSDQIGWFTNNGNSVLTTSTAVFRDPSAWYHIVAIANSTTMNVYVNNQQVITNAGMTNNTINSAISHCIGQDLYTSGNNVDLYLTEINFIDGQALDPTDFGEFDTTTGVWKPKEYTGTYGTNGFYLPTTATTQADGFNTVLYTGTGASQSISDVGFSPDLVWIKSRTSSGQGHRIIDTVRGAPLTLKTHTADAEYNDVTALTSFNTDGFTLGSLADVNNSGDSYVAWCWDAGSGSPVSNTDGDITSTVKANDATGFSIATYTVPSVGSTSFSFGHGLSTAPSVVISKARTAATGWITYHSSVGTGKYLQLNSTNAAATEANSYSAVSSTTVTGGTDTWWGVGQDYVSYCFSEVAGYSKFDSYTGTGVAGLSVTTGFRPAFVMIKRTDSTSNWHITDDIRSPSTTVNSTALRANTTDTETTVGTAYVKMTDTGFEITGTSTETNASGGTYIYMAFADTRDAQFNFDASGNKNNFTANNINSNAPSEPSYDIMTDVPTLTDEYTANYCTLNPLTSTYQTLANGNLDVSSFSGTHSRATGTIFADIESSSGYYFEITPSTNASAHGSLGISKDTNQTIAYNSTQGSLAFASNGVVYLNGSSQGTFSSWANNDVVGIWFSSGNVYYAVNGVAANSGSAVVTGLTGNWAGACWRASSSASPQFNFNFGQRPFAYTPPTGFLPLNTYNLPDATIVDGSQHMNVSLYNGTGASGHAITGVGFQPDIVWIKSRSQVSSHGLHDSLRVIGSAEEILYPNLTNNGNTGGAFLSSFDSDGFTVNNNNSGNGPGHTYVGWTWKAGGSGVSNSAGTNGATVASVYSANQDAGISIVTYTGTRTTDQGETGTPDTIYHGLGKKPDMVITKNRTTQTYPNWNVWHTGYQPDLTHRNHQLWLHLTNGANTAGWQRTDQGFTANLFCPARYAYDNVNGVDYVAYCFTSIEGFSSFGSYVGNGSSDGPFVYTGFKPAFLLIKRADAAANWLMYDYKRLGYNTNGYYLLPDGTWVEGTGADNRFDLISNGFKVRDSNQSLNVSGGTYVYSVFAENPFKNSLAR